MFEGKITFVGGSMRSGTSLLHSVMCGARETNDMTLECFYLMEQLRLFANWAQSDERSLEDFFEGTKGYTEFTRSMINDLVTLTHKQSLEPEHLIMKNADTTLYFPILMDFIPQAKYIVSVRDPKDVVASMLVIAEKQKEQGRSSNMIQAGRDMKKLTQIYLSFYRNLFRSRSKHNGRVMYVRYEDLVQNYDRAIEAISKFSGLDFSTHDPEAEWTYIRDRKKNAITELFDTKSRGKRITKANVGNYKDILSEAEAEEINEFAAPFMKNFNYLAS